MNRIDLDISCFSVFEDNLSEKILSREYPTERISDSCRCHSCLGVLGNICNYYSEMPNCNYLDCSFQSSEEFHVTLHHKLSHSRLLTIPMYELLDRIVKDILEGTESVISIQLKREDYLCPVLPNQITFSSLQPSSRESEKENLPPTPTPISVHGDRRTQLIPNSVLAAGNISTVSPIL